MTATLRPYLVIAAVDGKVGPMGGVDYLGAPALRATVKVKDAAGRVHAPLSDAELSADLRNLAAVLRTLFGSMLGAMGEGIEVFFFPANSADAPIAVALKEGAFFVTVGTQTFQWRLPLAALMPQKVCPEDGEKMSGAWKSGLRAVRCPQPTPGGEESTSYDRQETPSSAWTRRPPGNLSDASGDWLYLAAPWRTP